MRKLYKLWLSVFIFTAIATLYTKAQTANTYVFNTEVNATLDAMAGATTIVNASVDDQPSALQQIGFNFVYEGTTFTEFSASPDGFIRLGSPAATSQFTNSITNTTNIPKLFPFWDDHATGLGGSVRFVVTGTAPNRILKVHWFVTIPRNTGGSANSNFQLWLYETTNVIEFRYGNVLGPIIDGGSIGINGALATNFISVTASTTATSTTVANNTNLVWPGSGRLYRFTPPAAACAGPPVAGTISGASPICSGRPDTLTVSGYSFPQSGISLQWQSATAIGGPYTNILNATSNILVTGNLTATTYYQVVVTCANGGATATTPPFTVTVNPSPNITVNPAAPSICSGGAGVSLTASGGSTYSWAPATGLSGTTGATVTANPATTTTYTVTGTAANGCVNTANVTVTVNATPVPVITPANPRVCVNGITPLSTSSVASPITATTGTISVAVPDASTTGVTNTLAVAGVPGGATVTAVSVTLNFTHTWDSDLIVNLRAPNGNTLNLINQVGGSGDNFVNTVISSAGVTPIASGVAPFTGTFLPSAGSAITASVGFTSNVTTFAGLYSVPNGNWILSMRDAAGGDLGTLTEWSISVSFNPPATVWYPLVGLYTDAGATTPYTGTSLGTVYAKPTTSTTYFARVTAPSGCVGTSSVTVLVDQTPAPTITPPNATICSGDIQQLTATSRSTAAVNTTSSGAISVAVPDNNIAGANHTIAVAGIPAGAVITNVAVSFNITHTWDSDLTINVRAPNNNILNLVDNRGGSGDNFTNTVISSLSGLPPVSGGTAPFSNAYSPDGTNGTGATGFTSNVILFAGLFSTPNGNWTIAINDNATGDLGTLTSWSVTIYYLDVDNTTWAPVTGLYTDAGATTAYTGTNLATVYARPTTTTTYIVTATTPAGCTNTANVTITVNQPPLVTTQPANLSVCPGDNAVFTVANSGTGPFTYQWRKNGVNLVNGGNISGANTATLTVSSATVADNGSYDVVITGLCNPAATSNVATLVVGGPPLITTQPVNQIACAGNTVTFTVAASGPGLTYQWRKNGVNLVNGGNISGATSNTLVITNMAAGDAGNYDVIVTNACANSATSNTAVLTFSAANRWLGVANSDWNNPNNWCNGVPTSTTDVVIPAGTAFPAIIAVNADVRNLTIDAGASLSLSAAGWLNIYGNAFTLNGTFNPTAGTVGLRNIANLNVPAITVNNLVMNGAGGITLTGNLNITTALTLTNGNITLGNNNLTMTGGSSGSAASHIVTNGTGVVTNNNIGVPTVIFPVGPTATSYNPVWIAGGQGLNYSVRVATGTPATLANSARAINRTWTITSSATPANNVSLTFGYADADANASATPTANMEIGYFNGTAWVITTPAGGVPPSGTAAQRLVYTTSRNFGTMVVANVGGINTPTATPNLDVDLYSVKLLPNIVNQQSVLRVMSRRTMNVEWSVTDLQGRVVMKFIRGVLAGQNDINLKLGHLASGTYQIVGHTNKGITNVIQFVRL